MNNNYAFIDGQNLHIGISKLGWKIDYIKFRKYLYDKFNINKAFYFIGYLEDNEKLYASLIRSGYILKFKKPTIRNGRVKGNIDTELALKTICDLGRYNKAVIISGDGDFYCLSKHLDYIKKLLRILIPDFNYCPDRYRNARFEKFLLYMNDMEQKLSYKKVDRQS
ncbi:MAG: NYN domain-containing protein [Actinomycetota bacterium]|nr:MAG: NYN domain-containing protein [Actinomycetota bacterium]